MIVVNKIYQLSPASDTPPYNYSWSANNSCVSISPASGTTTDGKVSVTFSYINEACLASSNATISYSSTGGCSYSNTVTVPNVCGNLSLNDISAEGSTIFRTSAFTNLCASVDFTWTYDTTVYDLVQQSGSVSDSELILKLKAGRRPPASTEIKVRATDCYGCFREKTYNASFIVGTARRVVGNMLAGPSGFSSNEIIIPIPTNTTTPLWETLDITLNSPATYEIVEDNRIIFNAPASTPAGTIQGTYTVQDVSGTLSTVGDITLVVEGRTVNPINVGDKRIELPCTLSPSDIYEIVIDDIVSTTGTAPIDWSSWTLLSTPNPISSTITFDTNIEGQHVIKYTVPNPLGGDVFAWSICDTAGYCSEASVITLVDCVAPTTITPLTGCAVCNSTNTYDVLAANPTLSDLKIVSAADTTSGLTTVVADKINYVAGNKAGSNVITFTAEDEYNVTSNSSTETLTVICAGNNVALSTCTAVITPFNELQTLNNTTLSTTGTWSYVGITSPNPAAPGTYNGTLDFTSSTKDVPYVYRYTVTSGSCTDTADITITPLAQTIVQNTICSKSSVLPGIATDVSDTDYTYFGQSNKAACPGIASWSFSATAIPAQWQSSNPLDYAGDLWFRIDVNTSTGGSIVMAVDSSSYGGNQMYYPNLAIYSDCAGTLVGAFAPSIVSSLTLGNVSVPSSTTASYYIRVGSLLGNEGKFNLNVQFTPTI